MRKIRDFQSIKIWLIKVLINECNRIYRNKKKEISLQEKIAQEKLEEVDFTNENNFDFEILINGLKKEDRTVLTLYYGNNLTTKDIAQILNKNESTVRSRIKRAKEIIKNSMDRGECNGK